MTPKIRNIILGCLSILVITGCTNDSNFKERSVVLHDGLGIITLKLPNYYDTLHTWTRLDDHLCDDKICYRFQPSVYSTFEDKGIFDEIHKEAHFLTIQHYKDLNCIIQETGLIKEYGERDIKDILKRELDTAVYFNINNFKSFFFLIQACLAPHLSPIV